MVTTIWEAEIVPMVGQVWKPKGRAKKKYLPCPGCGVLKWKDVNKDGEPLYPLCLSCGSRRRWENDNEEEGEGYMRLQEAIVYGKVVMLPYTKTCGKDCFECDEEDCNWG
uniref:Uncharacterized protein n=1 Tax=viral metagenome TaxID=1070528 RepID=A0A6H2A356_9ZZZZ